MSGLGISIDTVEIWLCFAHWQILSIFDSYLPLNMIKVGYINVRMISKQITGDRINSAHDCMGLHCTELAFHHLPGSQYDLTLVLLNKLRCHTLF